mmetsp:Transcript_422/g.512  ORF Transcript_422/g.512 Transcript_422/m.512 type:complete len:658 (-) Transcript_422:345-2318(-)
MVTMLLPPIMSRIQSSILLLLAMTAMMIRSDIVISAFDCPGSKTPPLVLKGKRFYDSTTNQYFPIKGIAYYPRPNDGRLSVGYSVDFFTDEYKSRWESDIENMKELGVNAIRLYAVDPSQNHDAFMCSLSEAGIYITLGLLADCEDCGIGAWVGVNAEPPLCYPSSVKERGQFVIKSFSKYDNVIGFSAGNEVTIYADDGAGGPRQINAPCQKKFLNDMRKFVSGCSNDGDLLPRSIPIGIENWDGNAQTFDQHVYYHCRTDPNNVLENVEWFGINSYRHCDGSATTIDEIVGWPELRSDFEAANFPGPVLFGEYGCREQGFPTIKNFETQRTWLQAEALYTPDYSDIFAGGFVFEYSAEKKPIDDNLAFLANQQGLEEPTSEWPYQKFASYNYGVGYFDPVDCEHDENDSDKFCQYVKYPEFQGLLETLSKADTNIIRQQQQQGEIPDCPQQFPPLSFFSWPTDDDDNQDLKSCLENQSINNTTTNPTAAPSIVVVEIPDSTTVTSTYAPTSTPPIPTINTTNQPTSSTTINDPPVGSTIGTTEPTFNDGNVASQTSSPTTTKERDDGDDKVAPSTQCSDHSRCIAHNLTGSCCPTVDGVSLGCCDTPPTAAPVSSPTSLDQDANELELSSSPSWMALDYWYLSIISAVSFSLGIF